MDKNRKIEPIESVQPVSSISEEPKLEQKVEVEGRTWTWKLKEKFLAFLAFFFKNLFSHSTSTIDLSQVKATILSEDVIEQEKIIDDVENLMGPGYLGVPSKESLKKALQNPEFFVAFAEFLKNAKAGNQASLKLIEGTGQLNLNLLAVYGKNTTESYFKVLPLIANLNLTDLEKKMLNQIGASMLTMGGADLNIQILTDLMPTTSMDRDLESLRHHTNDRIRSFYNRVAKAKESLSLHELPPAEKKLIEDGFVKEQDGYWKSFKVEISKSDRINPHPKVIYTIGFATPEKRHTVSITVDLMGFGKINQDDTAKVVDFLTGYVQCTDVQNCREYMLRWQDKHHLTILPFIALAERFRLEARGKLSYLIFSMGSKIKEENLTPLYEEKVKRIKQTESPLLSSTTYALRDEILEKVKEFVPTFELDENTKNRLFNLLENPWLASQLDDLMTTCIKVVAENDLPNLHRGVQPKFASVEKYLADNYKENIPGIKEMNALLKAMQAKLQAQMKFNIL